MATELFVDTFETGDLSLWDAEIDPGGNMDVHADAARSGSFGCRIFCVALLCLTSKALGAAAGPSLWYDFYVRWPTLAVTPSGVAVKLIGSSVGGPTVDISYRKNLTVPELNGTIGGASSGWQQITGFIDNFATWQHVEIGMVNAGGACVMRWNDVEVASWNSGATATDFAGITFGNNAGGNWAEYIYVDDFYLYDEEPVEATPPSFSAPETAKEFVGEESTALTISGSDKTAAEWYADQITALMFG